jgi:hypothetical protein
MALNALQQAARKLGKGVANITKSFGLPSRDELEEEWKKKRSNAYETFTRTASTAANQIGDSWEQWRSRQAGPVTRAVTSTAGDMARDAGSAVRSATQYFSPTASAGQNFWQTPTAQRLADTQKFIDTQKKKVPQLPIGRKIDEGIKSSIQDFRAPATPERTEARWKGLENITVPFLRTAHPTRASLAATEKALGPRASSLEDIRERAPIAAGAGELLGNIYNVAYLSVLTGAGGIAEAAKGPEFLRTAAPYLYRLIPAAAKGGATWGLKGLVDEALKQYEKGEIKPLDLGKEALSQGTYGLALAPASQIADTTGRVIASGLTGVGTVGVEELIKKGEIDSESLSKMATRGILSAVFSMIGAEKTSRRIQDQARSDFSRHMYEKHFDGPGKMDVTPEGELVEIPYDKEQGAVNMALLDYFHNLSMGLKHGGKYGIEPPAQVQSIVREVGPYWQQLDALDEEAKYKVADQLVQKTLDLVSEENTPIADAVHQALQEVGSRIQLRVGKDVTQPMVEAILNVKEAIQRGEEDAAKNLYKTFKEQLGEQFPSFKEIKEQIGLAPEQLSGVRAGKIPVGKPVENGAYYPFKTLPDRLGVPFRSEVPADTVGTEIKPIDQIKEIAEYIKENYGRDLDSATPTQLRNAMNEVAYRTFPYSDELTGRVGMYPRGVDFDSRLPLLLGGSGRGVFTDGYILVDDSNIAKKINDYALKKEVQSEARSIRSHIKREGEEISLDKAKELARKKLMETPAYKGEGKYPETEKIIPKKFLESPMEPVAVKDLDKTPTIIFKANNVPIALSMDRVSFLKKFAGDDIQFKASLTGDNQVESVMPVGVFKGDKRIGVIMPIRFEPEEDIMALMGQPGMVAEGTAPTISGEDIAPISAREGMVPIGKPAPVAQVGLQDLAEEARKYKSAEEFIGILGEQRDRVLSGLEKVNLLVDNPIADFEDLEVIVPQLEILGIPVPRDVTGGIDVVELDDRLSAYLANHPKILKDFYNQVTAEDIGPEGLIPIGEPVPDKPLVDQQIDFEHEGIFYDEFKPYVTTYEDEDGWIRVDASRGRLLEKKYREVRGWPHEFINDDGVQEDFDTQGFESYIKSAENIYERLLKGEDMGGVASELSRLKSKFVDSAPSEEDIKALSYINRPYYQKEMKDYLNTLRGFRKENQKELLDEDLKQQAIKVIDVQGAIGKWLLNPSTNVSNIAKSIKELDQLLSGISAPVAEKEGLVPIGKPAAEAPLTAFDKKISEIQELREVGGDAHIDAVKEVRADKYFGDLSPDKKIPVGLEAAYDKVEKMKERSLEPEVVARREKFLDQYKRDSQYREKLQKLNDKQDNLYSQIDEARRNAIAAHNKKDFKARDKFNKEQEKLNRQVKSIVKQKEQLMSGESDVSPMPETREDKLPIGKPESPVEDLDVSPDDWIPAPEPPPPSDADVPPGVQPGEPPAPPGEPPAPPDAPVYDFFGDPPEDLPKPPKISLKDSHKEMRKKLDNPEKAAAWQFDQAKKVFEFEDKLKEEGLTWKEVNRQLEEGEDNDLVRELSQMYELITKTAESYPGVGLIPRLPNYTPHYTKEHVDDLLGRGLTPDTFGDVVMKPVFAYERTGKVKFDDAEYSSRMMIARMMDGLRNYLARPEQRRVIEAGHRITELFRDREEEIKKEELETLHDIINARTREGVAVLRKNLKALSRPFFISTNDYVEEAHKTRLVDESEKELYRGDKNSLVRKISDSLIGWHSYEADRAGDKFYNAFFRPFRQVSEFTVQYSRYLEGLDEKGLEKEYKMKTGREVPVILHEDLTTENLYSRDELMASLERRHGKDIFRNAINEWFNNAARAEFETEDLKDVANGIFHDFVGRWQAEKNILESMAKKARKTQSFATLVGNVGSMGRIALDSLRVYSFVSPQDVLEYVKADTDVDYTEKYHWDYKKATAAERAEGIHKVIDPALEKAQDVGYKLVDVAAKMRAEIFLGALEARGRKMGLEGDEIGGDLYEFVQKNIAIHGNLYGRGHNIKVFENEVFRVFAQFLQPPAKLTKLMLDAAEDVIRGKPAPEGKVKPIYYILSSLVLARLGIQLNKRLYGEGSWRGEKGIGAWESAVGLFTEGVPKTGAWRLLEGAINETLDVLFDREISEYDLAMRRRSMKRGAIGMTGFPSQYYRTMPVIEALNKGYYTTTTGDNMVAPVGEGLGVGRALLLGRGYDPEYQDYIRRYREGEKVEAKTGRYPRASLTPEQTERYLQIKDPDEQRKYYDEIVARQEQQREDILGVDEEDKPKLLQRIKSIFNFSKEEEEAEDVGSILMTKELPKDIDELMYLYQGAKKTIDDYQIDKLKIEWGDYDDATFREKMMDLEKEYTAAIAFKDRIEQERPEEIYEMELHLYSKEGPSSITVPQRVDWAIDQLKVAENTEEYAKTYEVLLNAGVITQTVAEGLRKEGYPANAYSQGTGIRYLGGGGGVSGTGTGTGTSATDTSKKVKELMDTGKQKELLGKDYNIWADMPQSLIRSVGDYSMPIRQAKTPDVKIPIQMTSPTTELMPIKSTDFEVPELPEYRSRIPTTPRELGYKELKRMW